MKRQVRCQGLGRNLSKGGKNGNMLMSVCLYGSWWVQITASRVQNSGWIHKYIYQCTCVHECVCLYFFLNYFRVHCWHATSLPLSITVCTHTQKILLLYTFSYVDFLPLYNYSIISKIRKLISHVLPDNLRLDGYW